MGLSLAWQFTELLPGTFERDRKEVAGVAFPIVGPLPPNGRATQPLEGGSLIGPYLYVLFNGAGAIKYVGVATEDGLASPLSRWIRPNKEGTKEYWAHGTNKKRGKATVAWLAEGLASGEGPFSLYFSNYKYFRERLKMRNDSLGLPFGPLEALTPKAFIGALEHALVFQLQPQWNTQKKKSRPPVAVGQCAEFWIP